MRGTTDAGIVAADQPFAAFSDFLITLRSDPADEAPQIVLDLRLVLRSRRNDGGLTDQAIAADCIAMKEESARSLGCSRTGRRFRFHRYTAGARRSIIAQDIEGLGIRVN